MTAIETDDQSKGVKKQRSTLRDLPRIAALVEERTDGAAIKHESVEMVMLEEGYEYNAANVDRVRSEAKSLREKKLVDLAEDAKLFLSINPGRREILSKLLEMGHRVTEHQARRLHESITNSKDLAHETHEIEFDANGHGFMEIRKKLDYQIIKTVSKICGLTESDAVSMILRAFLHSFTIHQLPIGGVLRTAALAGDLASLPALEHLGTQDLKRFVVGTPENYTEVKNTVVPYIRSQKKRTT